MVAVSPGLQELCSGCTFFATHGGHSGSSVMRGQPNGEVKRDGTRGVWKYRVDSGRVNLVLASLLLFPHKF